MKTVFRVDSSLQIGLGHVMRCLTLADRLRASDMEVCFVCRNHAGNINDFVRDRGYSVFEQRTSLSVDRAVMHGRSAEPYQSWLGVLWQTDAEQTGGVLAECKPNLLIVDHYALDARWELEMAAFCDHVMVIDDLAAHQHHCDMLLDQTTGRDDADYRPLVPGHAELLLGSDYALLRDEFKDWREPSLARRQRPSVDRVLLTFGGADADDTTSDVLSILSDCELADDVEVYAVMGKASPHKKAVETLAQRLPFKVRVLADVQNMAELMAQCDLCIGSAGTTSWERCCLGMPSIIVVVADNQRRIAAGLDARGAALLAEPPLAKSLPRLVAELNTARLRELSANAARLVDGRGADRVVERILSL